jgi:SAM-dependent methyltransferase
MSSDSLEQVEREKYEKVWDNPDYSRISPGRLSVPDFLEWTGGQGSVVDLGCGTGQAARAISEAGHAHVHMVDHAYNCRDESVKLPFYQQCLWELDLPEHYDYGFCCDVMEHIPENKVNAVFRRVRNHCDKIYYRIFLHKDNGKFTDEPLHLTVQPAEWWLSVLRKHYVIEDWEKKGMVATFKVATS